MFQFTATTVINSALDSNGTTAKYVGTASDFTVTRVGKFLASGIVGASKRAYSAEVLEEAEVTVPAIAAGLVARLDVDIRLSQQTHSEYANTYLYFKKPVVVEVIATGTAATDADALVAQLNGLKDRFGHSYFTAVAAAGVITVTAKDSNQRFFDIKVLKEDPSALTNSIIQPVFLDVTGGTFAVNTAGKIGFGDDNWMQRRIILPTAENTRYFGYSKEERPVLGGSYTQFTFDYMVGKDHSAGVELANNMSLTTQVFYVKSDLVAAFEDQLDNTTTVTTIV